MNRVLKYVAFLLVLLLAACKNKSSLESNGIPQTLIIGNIQTENFQEIKNIREKIREYLQKKLGMPVEMISSTDYNGIIEGLKSNKLHIANLPPFAYVIATRNMKLIPMVTLGSNGKPSTYHSVIMVNAKSNIYTIEDVKRNAKKLSFCFVEPASASGHLVPRGYLNTIGINPETDFKQTIFAGNHAASVLSIKAGKIDVGCTTEVAFNIMIRAKMLEPNDIRVIWRSEPIVNDPIVAVDGLNKDLVKRIQKAYLDMSKDEPVLLNTYVRLFTKDTAKRSYMIAQDSMYNSLRKIASGIKSLKAN